MRRTLCLLALVVVAGCGDLPGTPTTTKPVPPSTDLTVPFGGARGPRFQVTTTPASTGCVEAQVGAQFAVDVMVLDAGELGISQFTTLVVYGETAGCDALYAGGRHDRMQMSGSGSFAPGGVSSTPTRFVWPNDRPCGSVWVVITALPYDAVVFSRAIKGVDCR